MRRARILVLEGESVGGRAHVEVLLLVGLDHQVGPRVPGAKQGKACIHLVGVQDRLLVAEDVTRDDLGSTGGAGALHKRCPGGVSPRADVGEDLQSSRAAYRQARVGDIDAGIQSSIQDLLALRHLDRVAARGGL